jgi:hypothetical protein
VIHAYAGSVGKSTFAMRSYHLTSQFLYYRKHFSPAKLAMAIAGYVLRASWSIPFWTAAALVLPEHRGAAAHDQVRFWLQAYHLSLGAFKDLILGKVDPGLPRHPELAGDEIPGEVDRRLQTHARAVLREGELHPVR